MDKGVVTKKIIYLSNRIEGNTQQYYAALNSI
jgi:hypothetical protein